MPAPRVLSASALNGVTVDVLFDQAMLTDANFYDAGNYVLAGHTVTAVASPATNTARLTVSEMYTGEALVVEVDSTLQNAGGTAMDALYLEASFVGVGTAPTVASLTTPNSTTLRVTFSEGMTLDAELVDATNYTLTVASGGAANSISSIIPQAAVNPTYVDIILANEMTNGVEYAVSVATSVSDAVGNTLDGAAASATVSGLGTRPQVSSAVVRSDGTLRVTFNEPMRRVAALTSITNYTFLPDTGGSPLYAAQVVISDPANNPTYVDITVSEMTNGIDYDVVVANVVDVAGNLIDPANDTATFTGVGQAPTVANVIARSINRVDVVFSERMRETADIIDPANYTFDNGLQVLDVLGFANDTVQLVTSDQVPGVLYTLTVSV